MAGKIGQHNFPQHSEKVTSNGLPAKPFNSYHAAVTGIQPRLPISFEAWSSLRIPPVPHLPKPHPPEMPSEIFQECSNLALTDLYTNLVRKVAKVYLYCCNSVCQASVEHK